MPIITPAYPSMCATHNITMSTKKIILKELKRGGDICDKIFLGQLSWKDLFERHSFFTNGYKYYLSVVSSSRGKEAQLLWGGLVESKVRHLVSELEHDDLIEIAHPFNKGFERVHRCRTEEEIAAVMRGDLSYQAKEIKTETTDNISDPKHDIAAAGEASDVKVETEETKVTANGSDYTELHTTTYYIGLQLSQRKTNMPLCKSDTNMPQKRKS
jgi:poly(A) polymerase